jgi:hypothetical protein
MGDAQTQILACHELSQTRCSKRPFRKYAYPWDSRENVETCTEEEEQVSTKVFQA